MLKFKNIGELYYIHSIAITIILFIFYLFGVNNSFLHSSILNYKTIKSDVFDGTVYPIEYVPDPFLLSFDDRKKSFEEIDSKYFIKIPKYDINILSLDPEKLKPNTPEYINSIIQRVVYAVPYMGTYNFDYKEYSGSHPGIDIIALKNTPVKSIANGVVVLVGNQQSGFGKYVVIRHDNVVLPDFSIGNIYSLYAHLNEIKINQGVKVKKGTIIGTVGSSGNATTPHLHFQIDLEHAPHIPYWPFTSEDMKKAGVNFFQRVNMGLGKSNAINYTINPLKFVNDYLDFNLHTSGKNIENNTNLESIESNKENIIKEDKIETIKQENLELNLDIKQKQEVITNNTNNELNLIQNNNANNIINEIKKEQIISTNIELLSLNKEIELIDNLNLILLSSTNIDKTLSLTEKNDDFSLENLFKNLDEQVENKNLDEKQSQEVKKDKFFIDIKDDYKYINELRFFKEKNIISGFNDNTFRPKNNVSRAESLKIILLSFQKEIINNKKSKFLDIKSDSWENNYINSAIDLGIISLENKRFYPNRPISRVEALKIILNLGKFVETQNKIEIKDVSENNWYYKYVLYAVENELIPLNNGNFYPNKPISREELIYILYKFINK